MLLLLSSELSVMRKCLYYADVCNEQLDCNTFENNFYFSTVNVIMYCKC